MKNDFLIVRNVPIEKKLALRNKVGDISKWLRKKIDEELNVQLDPTLYKLKIVCDKSDEARKRIAEAEYELSVHEANRRKLVEEYESKKVKA